jgi:RNA polymerase sigma-70 factor (ECF subfamily)
MTATPTDEQDRLDMARLNAGHDAGLNDLMDRHSLRLFHYLLRTLQSEEDAADLGQETFVRVYHHRAEFDGERRFTTWLYTIASNLARDRLRWRARHPAVSLDAESSDSGQSFRDALPDGGKGPRDRAEANEQRDLIRQAIAKLPEDLRLPLILAEYEDRSHAEIGAILHCTSKAVEMRIYRARHELRRQLAPMLAG